MRSQRPYLLRALYEWIVDSGCTPHLLVDATFAGVVVPPQVVDDGRVVLNVAPEAVRGYLAGDLEIEFECRFGGVSHGVVVPVDAVLAIYARENGAGMAFEPGSEAVGDADGDGDDGPGDDDPPRPPRGGHLKVVK
ncbi:MAG TPA: ClpXP protease specificity-enhancing factor [Pseudomonadales bacterium]|nr:ClpXP protease specificity-enhancing factor [Pseudomonadales bacterium]